MREETWIHDALAVLEESAGSSAWIVGGSAGLLLRGLPLESAPNDIDIYCDMEDAAAIQKALSGHAVDEPVESATGIYRSLLSHYSIAGANIELVAGFEVTALGCSYRTEVRRLLIPHGVRLPVSGEGHTVHAVPLAHELWFNYLRGRDDRVRLIAQAFREEPDRHLEALAAIEAANGLLPEAVRRVHDRIGLTAERGGG